MRYNKCTGIVSRHLQPFGCDSRSTSGPRSRSNCFRRERAVSACHGGTCRIVIGSFVTPEWVKNAPTVLRDLTKHVQATDAATDLIHSHAELVAIPISATRVEYSKYDLPARLHELSKALLDAALALDADSMLQMRAYERVAVNPRRPSRLGGSELKDCTIFEECLEVARQLRAAGFTRKMVYCTSNTRDYCDKEKETHKDKVAHPDIVADCAPLSLTFVTTLPWALSELRAAP
jgi:hypothetical protein